MKTGLKISRLIGGVGMVASLGLVVVGVISGFTFAVLSSGFFAFPFVVLGVMNCLDMV